MSSLDTERVVRAIYDLGRVVTVADVTAATGLPLPEVRRLMNQVAISKDGWLKVHESGEIAYCFGDMGRAALQADFKNAIAALRQHVMSVMSYLLKLFVGIGLVLCLFFVFCVCLTTITFLVYLVWRASNYIQSLRHKEDEKPLNLRLQQIWQHLERFFLDCHQFVLGPGNPNRDLEQRHWHLIAEAIRAHRGVLVYEQLAPFAIGRFNFDREDAVLPVLLHFNGEPKVSRSGNIVYTFPELAATESDQAYKPERYLQEREWKLFDLKPKQLFPVALIIGFNLVALHVVASLVHMDFFLPLWQATFCYATALVILPIVRCLVVLCAKTGVDYRNARRRTYFKKIEHPSQALFIKLVEAKDFALEKHLVAREPVIYTTLTDSLNQQFDQLAKHSEPSQSTAPVKDDAGQDSS